MRSATCQSASSRSSLSSLPGQQPAARQCRPPRRHGRATSRLSPVMILSWTPSGRDRRCAARTSGLGRIEEQQEADEGQSRLVGARSERLAPASACGATPSTRKPCALQSAKRCSICARARRVERRAAAAALDAVAARRARFPSAPLVMSSASPRRRPLHDDAQALAHEVVGDLVDLAVGGDVDPPLRAARRRSPRRAGWQARSAGWR